MAGMAFMLMWSTLPVLWWWMLRRAGISFQILSIPLLLIVFLVVFQYMGLPLLYFRIDPYYADSLTDSSRMLTVFLYTSITITLVCLGFVLASLHWHPIALDMQTSQEPRYPGRVGWGILLAALVSTLVFGIYLYRVGIESNAFLIGTGLIESDLSIPEARSSMTTGFDGKYHWYKLFMRDILVFCSCAWFASILMGKRRPPLSWIILALLFIVTSFSMVVSLEKSPLAEYVIFLILTYLICKGGKIRLRGVLLSGFIIAVMLGLMYSIVFSDGINEMLMRIASRIFSASIQPAYMYLELFPAEHDFLHGRSFPNPRGIFPFEHYQLTVEVGRIGSPDASMSSVIGSYPTVFWAEMYANFGVWGVLIPPVFVGYLLYVVQGVLARLSFTPYLVALFVWLAMHYKNLALTSLTNYVIDTYVVGIALLFLILTLSSGWPLFRPSTHPSSPS